MPRPKTLILAAIALLALLGLLLLLWPLKKQKRSAQAAAAPAPGSSVAVASRSSAPPSSPSAEPATVDRANGGPSRDRIEFQMDAYKKMAVYPTWSRPLDEGAAIKLKWNDPVTEDFPFDDTPGQQTVFRFDADRAVAMHGEPYTSWIQVWELGDEQKRIPVEVHDAYVQILEGPRQGRAVTLRYHDDGKDGDAVAGDHIYTNRFVPSQDDELAKNESVRIWADVEARGVRRPMIRDFAYAARPTIEILGLSDALVNGSLVVTLRIEAFEAGQFVFDANLVGADGETGVAWTDQSVRLQPGKTTVDLTFFGKAVRDSHLDGPYVVRDLRGYHLFMDGEEKNVWWSDPRRYQTKPYKAVDFSEAEWDSEEKRDKIKRFEQMAAEAGSGGVAKGGKP